MIDLRLRARIPAAELDEKVGKVLTPDDFNVLLTGPTYVRKPDGRPLCVYLPAAIPAELRAASWPILSKLSRDTITANRGVASGSKRVRLPDDGDRTSFGIRRTEARRVHSVIVGAIDPMGARKYCRLTAWTGKETDQFRALHPLLRAVADQLRDKVPDRWAAQMREVERTRPEWVIEGTPFTTVTVNNTWETGVHQDKGDLDSGFSTLAVLRRGEFRGGHLVFPEYRIAVDMQDGDLLLMDAHEWHGNTWLDPRPQYNISGTRLDGWDAFERISVVSYFRTKMIHCGSPDEEASRAIDYAERRNAEIRVGE